MEEVIQERLWQSVLYDEEPNMRIGTKNHVISMLLSALILSSAVLLPSCGETADVGSGSVLTEPGTKAEEETETASPSRGDIPDSLPSDLDFTGTTVNILCRTKNWFVGEMAVDELNGEIVNDAVYDRNISVADRLKVDLNYIKMDDVTGAANTSITAGSDDYQIVVGSAVDIVQYGARGQYYNLLNANNVPYLDLEQPWWARHYTEQSSIGGKCFFVTGDLALSLTQLAFVTFFNKQMVSDFRLEDPYQLVRDGQWTIDKQQQMVNDVYVDLNGNSKVDKEDIFGFGTSTMIGYDVYWSAFDLTLVSRDSDGVPYIDTNIEKFQSAVDKVFTLFRETEGTMTLDSYDNDSEQDDLARKFTANELLFTTLRIMACDILRNMDADYGIIPVPKWDEAQDTYYTFVHDQYSVFGIPKSTPEPAMVSAVLEALAAENYRYVTPAYYDIALNGKYLRDTESSEMLELSLANVKIDFAWIYTNNLGGAAQNLFRYLMQGGSKEFTSKYASTEKALVAQLKTLCKSYDKIEE